MSTIDRSYAAAPRILAATRVLAGILMGGHGAQKLLLGAWGALPPGAPAGIVWAAGLIELIGGLLIARSFPWRVDHAASHYLTPGS